MNCKPGDLAVVVRSKTPSNVGKIVQVLRQYSMGDEGFLTLDTAELIWLCETKGSPLSWVPAHYVGAMNMASGPIPDECLKPLLPGERLVENSRELETI